MYNSRIETMPLEELRILQNKRLASLVKSVYQSVPFYRSQLDTLGIKPEDIRTIEDLPQLPFTKKN